MNRDNYVTEISLHGSLDIVNNIYEVKLMKDKDNSKPIDKNLFKEMNYEIAAEHGVIDNEDMKNNRRLNEKKTKKHNMNQKHNER